MIDETALRNFIDELWAKQGFESFGEAEVVSMKEDLLDRLESQLEIALTDRLPEEKVSELMKKMETGQMSDDEIASYLRENGVNIDETTAKTKNQFAELFLMNVATEGR